MAMDDLVNQGKKLYEDNKDKVDAFLKSDQAEQISDSALNAVADLAKKVVPDEHDAKVDNLRAQADKAVGTE